MMKKILILHPYRESYTNILSCLSEIHQYTILIDESKKESFSNSSLKNIEIAAVNNYQINCRTKAEELLSNNHFAAIIALDEFDVMLAAELREKYQIDGQNLAEAVVFRDKNMMTKRVKELGFRIPESQEVTKFSEFKAFLNKYNDIIVKPLSGAGSVDTFRVQHTDDITELDSKLFGKEEKFLVQEYIDKDIYHIDGFVSHGEVIYCEPSKYLYNPLLIKKGISAAAISLDRDSIDSQKLVDYATSLSMKLYPRGTFLFHLEVFYDLTDIIFLEIACRVGGARIRQNLEYKFGYSPYKLLIDSISGLQLPELPEKYPNTAWLLTAKRDGRIIELPNITEAIKQEFSIFDYIEYVKIGQQVNSAFHSADAVIGLSLSGENFKETEKALLSAEKWLLKHTRYDL